MDHHDRLAWADRQLHALEEAIKAFAKNEPCRLVRNFNANTGQHEASVLDVKPVDPSWALMIGDAVHAMRSALDNLVYRLAIKESGERAADCATNLQFPIADHPYGWFDPKTRKGQRDRVALLSVAAQTVVERLQPCNRPDKTKPGFLTVLRDLANRDKHRRLVLTVAQMSDVELTITGTGVPKDRKVVSRYRGPLKENAIVATWYFEPNITPPDMDVEGHLLVDVLFGDGPAHRQPVLGVLRYIHDHIARDVFPPLDALLA